MQNFRKNRIVKRINHYFERVLDAKAMGNHGMAHMGSRVSNKANFDRVLVKWTDILRSHLDEVNAAAGNTGE